uniref:Two-component response regulator n=1 Tax=Rhizophora mucronata TaxID=61149 RepID=A0A2P2J8M1_RHIMU
MAIAAAESQFHVLAVDDNLIDRTFIARLLKTSSYQGSNLQTITFLGVKRLNQVMKASWGGFIFHVFRLCSNCNVPFYVPWQLQQLILAARLLNFWVSMRMTRASQTRRLFFHTTIRKWK